MVAYGKGGEITSSRRDEQEMFVLCLRILQSALVYVNTLVRQDILGEDEWVDLLTPADRAASPCFWSRVRPNGEVNLDMAPASTSPRPLYRPPITFFVVPQLDYQPPELA